MEKKAGWSGFVILGLIAVVIFFGGHKLGFSKGFKAGQASKGLILIDGEFYHQDEKGILREVDDTQKYIIIDGKLHLVAPPHMKRGKIRRKK